METIAKGERREKRGGRGGAQTAGKARNILASTQYDFGGGVLTAYGGLLPFGGAVGEAGVVGAGRSVADGEAAARKPEQRAVCGEHGAAVFSGVQPLLPSALRATGRDGARGAWGWGAAAGAKHVLAVSRFAAGAQ